MATLTAKQIEQYAYEAGFRGAALKTAVAVALAESGGNTEAYNPELASSYSRPGAGSRGLWQIFGAVHPKYNSAAALDPAVNARGAYEIYRQAGNSFTPWSAFTQGTYKKYLSSVPTIGGQSFISSTSIPTPSGLAQARGAIGQTTTTTPSLLPSFNIDASAITTGVKNAIAGKTAAGKQREMIDVMFYVIGVILVILGLTFLFLSTRAGQNTVALGGEAAKLAVAAAL